MQEKYIDVNGWRTRYAQAGEDGPVLVLLHGLGSSLETWMLNTEALARDFRVYVPDMLYFGKSAKPPHAPKRDEFDSFVRAFMDALAIPRATLVGNSMGGAVAARVAIAEPARVEKLVLADPAGFGREIVWWLRLRTFVDLRSRGRPSPLMLRMGLRQVFYNPDCVPPEMIDAMADLNNEPGLFEAYRRVIRMGIDWRGLKETLLQDVRDGSHQINAPTLVVWGRQDRVVPISHMAVAQEKILHAQTYVFENCGHAPQIEYPEKFNALVREFVLNERVMA